MSQDRAIYIDIKCEVCGCAWLSGINKLTGAMEPGHPDDAPCSIHRPTDIAPPWVADALARHEEALDTRFRGPAYATASNLPASISDAEVARREVAGGVPTREWATAGVPPREFLAAVVARANGKNGEAHV